MSRLFVAVWPPPDVVEVLAALDRPDEPGVRWMPAHEWHVTLRFLGEADEAAVAAALRSCAWAPARAELGPQVSRLGRSIVCVPVAGLDDLAATADGAATSLGLAPDRLPYVGHVTLARLRHRAACGLAGARVRASFPVTEVRLVRSTSTRDGPIYEPVATYGVEAG